MAWRTSIGAVLRVFHTSPVPINTCLSFLPSPPPLPTAGLRRDSASGGVPLSPQHERSQILTYTYAHGEKAASLKAMKKNHEITPAVERLITEALAIEAESAQNLSLIHI